MIYRGPGLLAVVWFGSLPTLSPPYPVSRLDRRRHTGRLRKRDNLLTGEGEGGWSRSRIIPQESLVLYKLVNTLCLFPFLTVPLPRSSEQCRNVFSYPLYIVHPQILRMAPQSTNIYRVQSSVWRLPIYWPPPPLHPARMSSPRRAVRGWGVNILEDARHWIGLLQYNPSTNGPMYPQLY
jgi:hypothetical protein